MDVSLLRAVAGYFYNSMRFSLPAGWTSKDVVTVTLSSVALVLSSLGFYIANRSDNSLRLTSRSEYFNHIVREDEPSRNFRLAFVLTNVGNRDALVESANIRLDKGNIISARQPFAPILIEPKNIRVLTLNVNSWELRGSKEGAPVTLDVTAIDSSGAFHETSVTIGHIKNDTVPNLENPGSMRDVHAFVVDNVNVQLLTSGIAQEFRSR